MKTIVLILMLAALTYAQHGHGTVAAPERRTVTLDTGLGSVDHPVSTKNAEAQKFFNQGLAYLFAFNHDEGVASFKRAAEQKKVDAIVTLGCLIRGETAHYEAIYNEVSRGIGQSQQETGIPHGFGVLTCETLEQALNRAGIKAGNKGFEAAAAAIEMVSVTRKIAESGKA